jgi:hypothetical protein
MARKIKKPGSHRAFKQGPKKGLGLVDIGSLFSFRASGYVERNFLTFLEALEAIALNCRKVGEKIFAAAIRSNKTKTFSVVEPLDGTCCHLYLSFKNECGDIACISWYCIGATDTPHTHLNPRDFVTLAVITVLRQFAAVFTRFLQHLHPIEAQIRCALTSKNGWKGASKLRLVITGTLQHDLDALTHFICAAQGTICDLCKFC